MYKIFRKVYMFFVSYTSSTPLLIYSSQVVTVKRVTVEPMLSDKDKKETVA